ncbi:putative spermidine/putrescine transport system substrate-binding protein [Trueperella bonasi]|uniref:Spermidine/putrescine transport system substrate-binding protein n=1 Tax=Trueperella bonasi TaxID=312286 RepID=A0ABT9NF03_9ACTO|nr:extracellular solute-binding protein [Trueperella bonasi]MDP9805945.1 putative spermidine/putrescine transport system substrate-binding protein [Trueperella bonasi]
MTISKSRKLKTLVLTGVTALALTACGNTGALDENDDSNGGAKSTGGQVITYNSPAEWGNFGNVHKAFTEKTGIDAPNDPKNSGQALAALQSEKDSPVADVVYTGIAFAPQLMASDLLEPYVPENADQIDDNLKDPDGHWHTVHSGAVAFIVNEDFLDGAAVPQSWDDLLKPEYEGKVGLLAPTQAAVGYSVATAVNFAMGGDFENWDPGFEYLEALVDNGAIISAQTATAKVSQGEIPILIDADFNGYKLKSEGTNVTVVLPEEGTILIPYTMGLVKGAPNPENGKALLDFYFSEEGQALWAEGFMIPVIGEVDNPDMLPKSEYDERANAVDYIKQGEVQQDFNDLYRQRLG